jgi:hypothetical protein
MWNILWPALLVLSVFVLPLWLWHRMKRVQQAAREALDDRSPRFEAAWEETAASADGLRYGRTHDFDPALAKASRDAAGVDDVKNLEGRR